ncbi:hypothetical protein AAVH_27849 [Aphelenchoides avenae]|nr:hypothetical protein AAVH_27849 [Aphelenchus avenae]
MAQPPPGPWVPEYIRVRSVWASRLIEYLAQRQDGPLAVCMSTIVFGLDALLVNTIWPPGTGAGQGGASSYTFLRRITAQSEDTSARSYQRYFDREATIQDLHYANALHAAGLRLYNAICSFLVTPLAPPRDNQSYDDSAAYLGVHVKTIRRRNREEVLTELDRQMSSDRVGMPDITPMLTIVDIPADWQQPLWLVCAGVLDDFIDLPFQQYADKPFNRDAQNTVRLYDTVGRHMLHFDRVSAHGVQFDVVILPLRSRLQMALIKPVASLLDVLHLGGQGWFATAIDSALRKPRAPVRVQVTEINVDGGTRNLRQIFHDIEGNPDLALFSTSDIARLGIQDPSSHSAPLREIFVRSRLRIQCEVPQAGGSGLGGGARAPGLGAGGSGQGGGPSGSGQGGGGGATAGRKRGATATAPVASGQERGRQAAQPRTAKARRLSRSQLQTAAQPGHPMALRSRGGTQPRAADPAPPPPAGPPQAAQDLCFDKSYAFVVFLDEPIRGQFNAQHIVFAGTYRWAAGEEESILTGSPPSSEGDDRKDDGGGSGEKGKPTPRRGDGLGGQCGPEIQTFDMQPE